MSPMEVNFRDICGKHYNLQIPKDANVSDACRLLSKKIGVQENQIFLVSSDEDMNFYQNGEKMIDVIEENPEFVIFMKILIQNQFITNSNSVKNQEKDNIMDENQKSTEKNNDNNAIGLNRPIFDHYLKVPQPKMFNTFQSIKQWCYTGFYDEYAFVVNDIPHDFQHKVSQIAELGYSLDDIKEALRTTNYDVQLAIHYLLYHSNRNDDDLYDDDSDSEKEYLDDSDIEAEYVDEINQANRDLALNINDNDNDIKEDTTKVENNKDTTDKNDISNINNNSKINNDTNDDSKKNINIQNQNEIPTNPFYRPFLPYGQDKKQECTDASDISTTS